MKRYFGILLSWMLGITAVQAQNLAAYQSTITGQSPYYYNTLDNTLVPTAGTGTLGATGNPGFTNDFFGNANDAAFFTNVTGQLSLSSGSNVIPSSGANSVGSLSLLFYVPNTTLSSTRYIFSNGDASVLSTNQFALTLVGSSLVLRAGNLSSITNLATVTPGTWYYYAATWNFTGANTTNFGINWFIGAAGTNALSSGFRQRGGSGNINSTAQLGNGGTFTLSGLQTNGSSFQVGGVPGMVDELATWNIQLTSSQINAQYNALIAVPEPSTLVLCACAIAGVCTVTRRRRTAKK